MNQSSYGGERNLAVITINQFEGRTIEQNRKLALEITDAVVKIYEVSPGSVTITYFDIPRHNVAKGGVLHSDK